MHYKQTKRRDTAFWRHVGEMDVPATLEEKMALFERSARLRREPEDLFRESSWVQVMVGQGLKAKSYHPMADRISSDQLARFLGDVQSIIAKAEAGLPMHADFINAHCKSDLQ